MVRAAGYGALLILFYWGLQNLALLKGWFSMIFGLLSPFLLGLVLAFMINLPMSRLEKLIFKKYSGRLGSMARVISLVLTLVIIVGIIFVVFFLVVPELSASLITLGNSIPGYLATAGEWASGIAADYPDLAAEIAAMNLDWNSLVNKVMSVIESSVTTLVTSTVNTAAGIFSGLFSFFLALIFAVYVLLQKETMGGQVTQLLEAFVPEKISQRIVYLAALTNRTFSSFLSGQCLEAVILGAMFFVTMGLFKLPYALMISVLIGFTALIPIFGAFIGCAIGTFLILMVNPMQALWFLVIFIVLQQVEGNLIYPKVVGGSIGLPPIWVLLAVTVGGSAMGIVGMLVFIPICSVLYTVLWEEVYRRKAKKTTQTEEAQ